MLIVAPELAKRGEVPRLDRAPATAGEGGTVAENGSPGSLMCGT
jgi:hypothetical protein